MRSRIAVSVSEAIEEAEQLLAGIPAMQGADDL
jgi:hypothetical protein